MGRRGLGLRQRRRLRLVRRPPRARVHTPAGQPVRPLGDQPHAVRGRPGVRRARGRAGADRRRARRGAAASDRRHRVLRPRRLAPRAQPGTRPGARCRVLRAAAGAGHIVGVRRARSRCSSTRGTPTSAGAAGGPPRATSARALPGCTSSPTGSCCGRPNPPTGAICLARSPTRSTSGWGAAGSPAATWGASVRPRNETLLLVESGELFVHVPAAEGPAWLRLTPGDAAYLPAGTEYRLVEQAGAGATYVAGAGTPGAGRLDAVTTVAVALDAGGSKIAGGLVTLSGEVSTERRVATEGDGVEQTAALARDLAAAALARGLEVAGSRRRLPGVRRSRRAADQQRGAELERSAPRSAGGRRSGRAGAGGVRRPLRRVRRGAAGRRSRSRQPAVRHPGHRTVVCAGDRRPPARRPPRARRSRWGSSTPTFPAGRETSRTTALDAGCASATRH